MIAGRALGRRLSSAKTGGDTSAGRTWPFKANIPKISYVIRLFLGLRFLSGLFFLSLHLCLNGLHLVFLGFDIRIILVNTALGRTDLAVVRGQFLLLGTHQLLYRSLFCFRRLLKC